MDVFTYWNTGRSNAPAVVKKCFERWEQLNPGHQFHVLKEADLRDIVTDLPFDIGTLPVQAQSDILRIRLLREHGGAWVDATVLPMLPLDAWYESYVGQSGLFMFHGRPSQWKLGNNLILARKGNHFIEALDDAARAYWTHPRTLVEFMLPPSRPVGPRGTPKALLTKGKGWPYVRFVWNWHYDMLYPVSEEGRETRFYPYFWQMYLMMQLIETDSKVRAIVEAMTYRNHELCHTVQHFRGFLAEDFEKSIPTALLCSPVQKLDWRVEWPDAVFALPDPERVLI